MNSEEMIKWLQAAIDEIKRCEDKPEIEFPVYARSNSSGNIAR